MRVLVTGGAGVIVSHVVDALLAAGVDLVVKQPAVRRDDRDAHPATGGGRARPRGSAVGRGRRAGRGPRGGTARRGGCSSPAGSLSSSTRIAKARPLRGCSWTPAAGPR